MSLDNEQNSDSVNMNVSHNQNQQNLMMNYNDPYFLSSADSMNASLTPHVFTGSNFINWSRSVKVALVGRNKLGFINGALKKLAEDSSDFQKWIRNDSVVMSWLMNSMEKSMAEDFIFINTSEELWKEVCERFGHTNVPR